MTDKDTECGKNDILSYAASGMQGWRVSMEDSHIADLDLGGNKNHHLFGVFDGHGGMEVAEYVKRHFTQEFLKNSNYKSGKFQ